ncbi:hypothetical protein QSU92_08145 [Microbacterium sp. ET2]|uniref:hypothetical protein n=1 Tax=Microbacterium albipurpureum TaxID=3050384 RepID=UPI00259CBA59|nr:hypothetical protein [Microbacterium sp. ET2 (Ac-2212)]WJL97119.1 hypothetical protein QSU92_08145 [Microbacterium sp. ET2 (Ac-2212)]
MRLVRAGLYLVQAVIVGVVITLVGMPASGEVTARLGGADVVIATVHAGWAAVVLLAFGGLVDAAVARIEPLATRARLVTWIGWSQLSGVAVFLIAQLNGITELTTLVALYALAAGAVMLLALDGTLVAPRLDDGATPHEISATRRSDGPVLRTGTSAPVDAAATPSATRGIRGLRRPAAPAAVIGIVPWGSIAFAQIGGGILGDPVGLVTRVVTLIVLALSIAVWFRGWFRPADADAPGILPLLATTALAWGVVLAAGG